MYQDFIRDSLEDASKVALTYFGKTEGWTKPSGNIHVLTKADLEIGKLLTQTIIESFPEHNIIDEELGVVDNNSDYTWTVDPIDGTSNFAVKLPFYGVMIGLLKKNTPLAGGLALPSFGEVYSTEKGEGVLLNGKRIRLKDDIGLSSSLVSYGIDGDDKNPSKTSLEAEVIGLLALRARNIRTTNSAYDVAQVINGKFGAFLNMTSKVWDNVAAQVLVEEYFGDELNYSSSLKEMDKNYTFCAARPGLHKDITSITTKFKTK